MAGGTDITSGGTEGTGEGGTKANGAAGLPGGRGGCGVENVWGGRDGSEDPLGEEKEQVAAEKKSGEEKNKIGKTFHLIQSILFLSSCKIFKLHNTMSQELF